MKIDLDYIKEVSDTFKRASENDIATYTMGRYCYTVEFTPETGATRVHIQWPLFYDLTKDEYHGPEDITEVSTNILVVGLIVRGVGLVALRSKNEIVQELQSLGFTFADDALLSMTTNQLFAMWKQTVHWNMPEE